VVTAHGGTVEISESGAGGALFRVRIPRTTAKQPITTA
jgi:signal transduction histidine kinase